MGMYTEIHVAGELPLDHPAAPIIGYLFGSARVPSQLPEHKFFALPGWRNIGHSASWYLSPVLLRGLTVDSHGSLLFHSVSNIKNYCGEIDAFFDWLRSENITHYGHARYEETLDRVTLYHFEAGDADK